MSEKVFYIYIDKTNDGEVFYVGKGLYSRIYDGKIRNIYWKNVAQKYGQNREVIFATKDEQFAFEMEKIFIEYFQTFSEDFSNKKNACNLTKGGEGTSGLKFSEEHKRKLGDSKKGNKHYLFGKPKSAHPMYGKPRPEKTKIKISKAQLGEKNHAFGRKGKLHPNYGKIQPLKWREQHSEDVSGEKNGRALLTLNQVKEIRDKYSTGNYFQRELAAEYKVTRGCISGIVSGKNWKI